jgi:hypothetical protein
MPSASLNGLFLKRKKRAGIDILYFCLKERYIKSGSAMIYSTTPSRKYARVKIGLPYYSAVVSI